MKRGLAGSKHLVSTAMILVGILATSAGFWSCSARTDTITIGITPNQAYSLVYVAEDRRFFARNGISVIEKHYEHGAVAADALMKGEVDIAGSSEYPIVSKAFQKEKISVISNIDAYEGMYLASLKDRGIQGVSDLKGKRVGLLRKSIVEFYLARALFLSGVNKDHVTLLDFSLSQLEEDLLKGNFDALVLWQPLVYQMQARLADRLAVQPVQSNQLGYVLMISRNDWIQQHPQLVQRFLRALADAEDYSLRHPGEAQAIMQKRLNYDDSYVASIWSAQRYSLTLDLPLITAMNDEARWMIDNNLTADRQVPDFKDFIYLDGLRAVRPRAVNITR